MTMLIHWRRRILFFAAAVVCAAPVIGAEIHVMISGGFSAAYAELVPQFERATGHKVSTVRGASMGTDVNALPVRLQRGEPADVLILVDDALEARHVVGDHRGQPLLGAGLGVFGQQPQPVAPRCLPNLIHRLDSRDAFPQVLIHHEEFVNPHPTSEPAPSAGGAS